MSAPDYLIRLREATRHVHRAAEEAVGGDRLLGDAPTRSHYQLFLGTHFLFHGEVARHGALHVERVSGLRFLDWPDCPRTQALAEDLEQLDGAVDATAFHRLPYVSQGFTLGLVYVCEGSCIGNQRVFTALDRHEDFHRWNAASFLGACKPGFADRWRSLLASMEQVVEHHATTDGSGYRDMERGAISGFQLYIDYWHALRQAEARNADGYAKRVA